MTHEHSAKEDTGGTSLKIFDCFELLVRFLTNLYWHDRKDAFSNLALLKNYFLKKYCFVLKTFVELDFCRLYIDYDFFPRQIQKFHKNF